MTDFTLDITDQQTFLAVDHDRLRTAIARVLTAERIDSAEISLALVDDSEIQRVHREFLGHDYPTDVISFLLNDEATPCGESGRNSPTDVVAAFARTRESHALASVATVDRSDAVISRLEGEVIVSTETALREAAAHGWSPADEVLLYVVHGLLHLCGYDDLTDEARPLMRAREREVLAGWQLVPTGLEA